MGKKVLFFTTFYEVDSGYSLVSVVETQLRMLLDNGYQPVVLVDERFQDTDKQLWQSHTVDIRPVIPRLDKPDNLTERAIEVLESQLENIDVVITHDIILHSFYKSYFEAIKQFPDVLWLNWIHSRPSGKRDTPPGYVIYPNASEKSLVCQTYGLANQEHRVITNRASHTIDPLEIWPYLPLTKDLIKASGFLGGDFSLIYPRGADPGKQTEKIIYLLAGMRLGGYEPRLLIVDWQSQGNKFQKYMNKIEQLAEDLEVSDCIYFTSKLDDRCSQGIPRQSVIELLDLSNIYIHPSNGETYGLVIHEAMLRGNLCILNHDVSPMRELFGESAIYMDFSSATVERNYHPDEKTFWQDEAKRLIVEFKRNRVLVAKSKAQREWIPQAQWREFEPLLFL